MKKVVIVDTYNIIHISRFGLPFENGFEIVYNFFNALRHFLKNFSPDEIYFAIDGKPQSRLDLSSEYKQNRKKEITDPEEIKYWDSFHKQKNIILEMLNKIPVNTLYHPYIEGDDVVYYICKKLEKNSDITIVSSDTDFIQILNEFSNVKLFNPVKKQYRDNTDYDYVSWKAMVGDRSDNIPGVKRIGKVTATKILKEGALSERLKDQSFKQQYDLSYSLIKLNCDYDLFKEVRHTKSTFKEEELFDAFNSMEFNSYTEEKAREEFVRLFKGLNNGK